MNEAYRYYFIRGFRLEIAPDRWRQTTIHFRIGIRTTRITGIEIFTDTGAYLGFVIPENISLGTAKVIQTYIAAHHEKWIVDAREIPKIE